MRHIVMMRLKPGVFDEAAEREYRETFDALAREMPEEILRVQVHRNIVDRAQNMTVMIEMTLREEASLQRYLTHPLHVAMGKKYNPYVEAIASFDCPD
ncbi:MAG: Dabb family protein [Clostridia bacterium]|nr:Dabb family protein [Clostridia bacterium]